MSLIATKMAGAVVREIANREEREADNENLIESFVSKLENPVDGVDEDERFFPTLDFVKGEVCSKIVLVFLFTTKKLIQR